MADNFSVATTVEKYTWGNIAFTWGGCRKLWGDAGYHTYTAQNDSTISIAEKAGRGYSRKYLETIGITDKQRSAFKSKYAEKLRFSETYWDHILFRLQILESFKTRDVVKNNVKTIKKEKLSAGDKMLRLNTLTLTDSLTISDRTYKKIAGKIKDGFIVSDKIVKKTKRTVKDSFTINDKAYKHAKINSNGSLTIGDDTYKSAKRLTKENFAIGDKIYKKAIEIATENIDVAENISKAASHKEYEEAALIDEYSRNLVAYRGFFEDINVKRIAKKYTKQLLADTITFAEWNNACMQILKTDEFILADEFSRIVMVVRTVDEQIELAELAKKHAGCNLFEVLAARDVYIKACESVLSNLYITRKALDENGFRKLVDTPSGYENFIDFKVGEYEYKDALVRVTLQSRVPQLQPTAADIVMHVDIPDTDDRGMATITDTAAGTKVYYNKHYYNAPEVNVVVRGGSTADGTIVPYIITTDGEDDAGRYFEIELINSNNERTTGTISWVSKGY